MYFVCKVSMNNSAMCNIFVVFLFTDALMNYNFLKINLFNADMTRKLHQTILATYLYFTAIGNDMTRKQKQKS